MPLTLAAAMTLTLQPADPQALAGEWTVRLFFSDDAPPSETVMTIEAVDGDGALTGSFYGSPFGEARARVFEDGIIFTAVTQDNSGPYLHSGRLEDGEITGQTLSTGRDFLMGWRASRIDPEAD